MATGKLMVGYISDITRFVDFFKAIPHEKWHRMWIELSPFVLKHACIYNYVYKWIHWSLNQWSANYTDQWWHIRAANIHGFFENTGKRLFSQFSIARTKFTSSSRLIAMPMEYEYISNSPCTRTATRLFIGLYPILIIYQCCNLEIQPML